MKKIKEIFDEDEYITLKNKINNIENNNKIYKKHSVELNKYNSKITTLEEQNKYLSVVNKESNINFKA